MLSLFFYPLVKTIGGGFTNGVTTLYPTIAAPLVLVGTMMLGGLRHIAWDDATEAVPAFLTLVMMPLDCQHHRRRGLRTDLVRDPQAGDGPWP